jgi:hypothetical protein
MRQRSAVLARGKTEKEEEPEGDKSEKEEGSAGDKSKQQTKIDIQARMDLFNRPKESEASSAAKAPVQVDSPYLGRARETFKILDLQESSAAASTIPGKDPKP